MTNRIVKLASIAALSTLALTACQSAATTSTSPSANSTTAPETTSTGTSSSGTGGDLTCPAGKLVGEGSSAQKTAVEEIVNGYNDACQHKATIEYNPAGSGNGIKNFNAKLVDWAGSDSALKDKPNKDNVIETEAAKARCGGNPAWNLPMVVGPVAFAYNLQGVNGLVLTPEVISKIFYGQIKNWNDPAIAALNSGVTLPSAPITVFYRSDESGTSENVSKFLKAAGKGAWADEPAKKWTGKVGEGKEKSSGVANAVKSTPNSFTYVEWSYATENQLGIAKIDNGAGPVELSAETVAKAVEAAEMKGEGNDLKLGIKYTDTGAGAYPALLVTYEIVCSKGLDADKTALLKDFLGYFASNKAQQGLVDLGYAPLPTSLQAKVTDAIKAIG